MYSGAKMACSCDILCPVLVRIIQEPDGAVRLLTLTQGGATINPVTDMVLTRVYPFTTGHDFGRINQYLA